MIKRYNEKGFTLIELMVVVILVGIIGAIVAPQLIHVNDRGNLEEVVNSVERMAAQTKALAIKSRSAFVLEVRGDKIWVNRLVSNDCSSDFAGKCVVSMGKTLNDSHANFLSWDKGPYKTSGVAMCDLRVAAMGTDSGTCDITSIAVDSEGAGLCYNGSGQLFIRKDIDVNAACDQSSDPSTSAVWEKACVPWVQDGADATDAANQFSGADIRFNRFKSAKGNCTVGGGTSADVRDVTRQILIPAGGHPIVRLP